MRGEKYFDNVSRDYMERISSGLLGKLKSQEQASIIGLASPNQGCSVLDIGCGPGYHALELKRRGYDVFGIDISPKMVEEAKKNGIRAEVHDIETLRLKERFKMVLCAGVFEFCEDLDVAIGNCVKHLSSDGHIIFLFPRSTPFVLLYGIYHRTHGVQIKVFSFDRLKQIIERHGMEIVNVEKPNVLSYVINARFK